MRKALITLLFFYSCVEVIDFEPSDSFDNAISIQAKLVKGDPSQVTVRIQEVFDFQSFSTLISVKKVFVEDEGGNRLSLNKRTQGVYHLSIPSDHPEFKVEYYKRYRVQIINQSGQSIASQFDELFPVPSPDSLVSRKIDVEVINVLGDLSPQPFIGFYISTPTKSFGQQDNSRMLWEMTYTRKVTDTPEAFGFSSNACCGVRVERDKKECYVTKTPAQNSIVYDASGLTIDRIESFEVYKQAPTFLFAEGFFLNVHQQSLSKAAFEYWKQVGLLSSPEGNVFQEPVGRLTTNFENLDDNGQEIFGFFMLQKSVS